MYSFTHGGVTYSRYSDRGQQVLRFRAIEPVAIPINLWSALAAVAFITIPMAAYA